MGLQSPVYHPWSGSFQRNPVTHSLPLDVPGNGSWNSLVGISPPLGCNILSWARRSNALSLQAVLPSQKRSEMGPGPRNKSLVASEKLRAFLEIPRNPAKSPILERLIRSTRSRVAGKRNVVSWNLDSQDVSLD